MENRGRNDGSGNKSPFPANQDFEFEIGIIPSGTQSSPAGQLFYNGQLLPHVFPSKSLKSVGTYSRSTSRENYKSRSSRSNSTSSRSSLRSNSTSSNSSSRRTSISESRDQKVKVAKRVIIQDGQKVDMSSLLNSQNGSQRWQYITQTPVLNRKVSRKKSFENTGEEELITKKGGNDREAIEKAWFGRRIFTSFVSSCKQCHAMELSIKSQMVLPGGSGSK